MFQSTARDFIEKAIEADRKFLATFDPQRDKGAFEREWNARKSGARSEVNAFEPNYEGSSIVSGRPGSRCSALAARAAARAGHLRHPSRSPPVAMSSRSWAMGHALSLGGDDTICGALRPPSRCVSR